MYAEERHAQMLGILKSSRKISVSDMSDRFGVSGATIRTDLRHLEEAGLLTRTHGGAIMRTHAPFEIASNERAVINLTAKERIGKAAAAMVEEGDIIVLDTGTTTLHLARHLHHLKNLTVVTNDYEIVRELENHPAIQIILLGGIIKKGYRCAMTYGFHSLITSLNVDKAFMAVNGFSLQRGACVADLMLAETKKSMVENASQVVVLCDQSKINNTSLAQFLPPENVHTLITDALPGNAEEYRTLGISIISVPHEDAVASALS